MTQSSDSQSQLPKITQQISGLQTKKILTQWVLSGAWEFVLLRSL